MRRVRIVVGSLTSAALALTLVTGAASAVSAGVAELTCHDLPATIVGTAGPDILVGTPGDDVIVALGGNDTVTGGGGADVICGSAGDDSLKGYAGEDTLKGGPGTDALGGGFGFDICLSGEALVRCEADLPDFGTGFGSKGTGTCLDTTADFTGFDLSSLPTHKHRPTSGVKFFEIVYLKYGPVPFVNVLFTMTSPAGQTSATGGFNASSGTVTVAHGMALHAGDSVHVVASWERPPTFLEEGRHWGSVLASEPELPTPIPQVGSYHYDFTAGPECV